MPRVRMLADWLAVSLAPVTWLTFVVWHGCTPNACAVHVQSDVWALGCVLYELTTLNYAFDGANVCALVLKILRGKYPPIPDEYRCVCRCLRICAHTPRCPMALTCAVVWCAVMCCAVL